MFTTNEKRQYTTIVNDFLKQAITRAIVKYKGDSTKTVQKVRVEVGTIVPGRKRTSRDLTDLIIDLAEIKGVFVTQENQFFTFTLDIKMMSYSYSQAILLSSCFVSGLAGLHVEDAKRDMDAALKKLISSK